MPLFGFGGPTAAGVCVLGFGANNVLASVDVRCLFPWFADGACNLNTSPIESHVPFQGTLRNLRVRHNTANGNGNGVDYTVVKNGVATTITCSLATGAVGSASDLVNSIQVAAGDLVRIDANKSLALGSGVLDVTATLELSQ